MRIASLAASNTEIVAALGCDDKLVGVDDYSNYPAETVEGLPKLGPELDIRIDRLIAVKPDLVLASLSVPGDEKVVERVRETGLPMIVSHPLSLDDIYDNIVKIGTALDADETAEAIVSSMRSSLVPQGKDDEYCPTLLVEWWPKPVIAPGKLSWVNDLINLAGGYNPLGEEDVASRPLTNEEAAGMQPDAAIISWCGVTPDKYRKEVVLKRKGWSDVPAVHNERVFAISEAFLGRPGPRLVEGLERLRQVVVACQPGGTI